MRLTLSRRSLLLGSAAVGGLGLMPAARGLRAQSAAAGARRALLVGVTEYPYLPRSNWLSGPNNDVLQTRAFLLANPVAPFEAGHVTVLADELDFAAAPPTLAAIRGAMADLAAAAGPGDIVYLQFSGHGHQQKARFDDEIDGLDEVFMPRDVEIMRRGMTEWPNAYVDKDIKADIDAIRAKGAFVWALFDCCHSATMTRNLALGDSAEVARKVDLSEIEDAADPAEFAGASRGVGGTPRQTMLGAAAAVAPPPAAAGVEPGGLVAFYASQTIEPTFELPLPPGAEDRVQMGLFTWTVLSRLAENPLMTYRQLGEAVLQSYTAMNRTRPIPMFEGDEEAMETRVLGSEVARYTPQWPLIAGDDGWEIAGGSLHGLTRGSRLAVMERPQDDIADAIGLVEVVSATSLRSRIGPLTVAADEDAPALPGLVPETLPGTVWLRMVERVIEMELTVATPGETAHPEATAGIGRMIEALAADEAAPFRLRLVPPGAPADLRLDVLSRAEVAALMRAQEGPRALPEAEMRAAEARTAPELWLLDAGASLSLRSGLTPYSLDLAANDAEEQMAWLRETMIQVYRAIQLSRLTVEDQLTGSRQVTVDLLLRRGEEDMPLSAASVPAARPGDQIWLKVVNNSSVAVDAHALFIGTDYSIVAANRPERLQPGNTLLRGLFAISDTSFGRERVVVALAEEEAQAPQLNLSFLAQGGIASRGLGATRGVASGLRGLLRDVAEAPMTRGALALGAEEETGRGALLVYSLDVGPAE